MECFTETFENNMFGKKAGENSLAKRKTSDKNISGGNFCDL